MCATILIHYNLINIEEEEREEEVYHWVVFFYYYTDNKFCKIIMITLTYHEVILILKFTQTAVTVHISYMELTLRYISMYILYMNIFYYTFLYAFISLYM